MAGMSHPRMDFIALSPRSKSWLKRQLKEDGVGAGFYSNENKKDDADAWIERIVRDGAMTDPVFLRNDI